MKQEDEALKLCLPRPGPHPLLQPLSRPSTRPKLVCLQPSGCHGCLYHSQVPRLRSGQHLERACGKGDLRLHGQNHLTHLHSGWMEEQTSGRTVSFGDGWTYERAGLTFPSDNVSEPSWSVLKILPHERCTVLPHLARLCSCSACCKRGPRKHVHLSKRNYVKLLHPGSVLRMQGKKMLENKIKSEA